MGEGLLLAIAESGSSGEQDGNEIVARLMLLLKIVHQVLLSDCPTVASPAGGGAEGGDDNDDKWEKSSQLRLRLGEITILPLFQALASSLSKLSDATKNEQYQSEVKGMMDEWKEHNVFGGPTVLEEYKKGWNRALKEVAADGGSGEGGNEKLVSKQEVSAGAVVNDAAKATMAEPVVTVADDSASKEVAAEQSSDAKESTKDDDDEDLYGDMDNNEEAKDESDEAAVESKPASSSAAEGSGEGKSASQIKKNDSFDVEVDFSVSGVPLFFSLCTS